MLLQSLFVIMCLVGGILTLPAEKVSRKVQRKRDPRTQLPPRGFDDKPPHPPPNFDEKPSHGSHPPPQFEERPPPPQFIERQPHPPPNFEDRRPPPPPPQEPYHDDLAEPRNYEFNYLIDDQYSGNFQTREETKDGPRTIGSYSLREPTGAIRIVKYIADHHGFRAIVHRVWPDGDKTNQ